MRIKREEPLWSTGIIFTVSAGALVADQEIQDQESEVEHQVAVALIACHVLHHAGSPTHGGALSWSTV